MKIYKLEVRRMMVRETQKVNANSPQAIAAEFREDFDNLDREHFKIIHLNTKNNIIGVETISIGSLNSSIVHPREVFKSAIIKSSASIICLHNHPSGDTKPSRDDIDITQRLIKAGEIIGIKVLDHLIIGEDNYLSMKEEGII